MVDPGCIKQGSGTEGRRNNLVEAKGTVSCCILYRGIMNSAGGAVNSERTKKSVEGARKVGNVKIEWSGSKKKRERNGRKRNRV